MEWRLMQRRRPSSMGLLRGRCCTAWPTCALDRRSSCMARQAESGDCSSNLPRMLAALRALGAESLDYRSNDLVAQVQALAPGGVAAVFDHLGGASLHTSWRMLAPGGSLVSYGLALLRDSKISMVGAFIPHLTRIYLWNL